MFSKFMNRLIEHIERLLLLHDCVIIPGFGGFVLRSVSALYNAETSMFFPPRKEVVFNQTLDHNDGLLMESYMKEYKTDFSKASQWVGDDVTLLKGALENEGKLSFGTVGTFVKDEERLVFTAGKDSDTLFCSSSFGLPAFHCLPLQKRKQTFIDTSHTVMRPVEEENKASGNGNTLIRIPVTKTFVRTTIAIAAAILLFLLISTPVRDVNKESYRASFVPHDITSGKTADGVAEVQTKPEAQEEENKIPENNIQSETPGIAENTIKTEAETPDAAETTIKTEAETETKTETKPIAATSAAKTEKAPDAPANTSAKKTATATTNTKSEKNTEQKNYYVIIGSFDTRARANAFIKNLKSQEAGTAGIITVNGHVRVYAQGFATEKSANTYMNKLRQTTHKQAWVYKARD
jgi:cell division septation protein DedD